MFDNDLKLANKKAIDLAIKKGEYDMLQEIISLLDDAAEVILQRQAKTKDELVEAMGDVLVNDVKPE